MPISKIKTTGIEDSAVTSSQLEDNSVTSAKIGVDVIVAEDIANNAITVAELADDSVSTAKIQDDAVTNAKIANDAVDTAELVDGAVTSAKLDTNIDVAGTLDVTGDLTADSGVKLPTASGGVYTITGTDTATNRSLTLPDEAGTIVTNNGAVFTGSVSTTEIILTNTPETISSSVATFSRSTNSYAVMDTISAPSAGIWKISIFASITSTVNGKIAVFYNDGSAFAAASGYNDPSNSCFAEEIVELDGINDVTFQGARHDDGGGTTMKALRLFGVKIG